MPRFPEDPEQVRMTFGQHLEELRARLIRGLVAIAALFVVGWFGFNDQLQRVFLRPYQVAVRRTLARRPDMRINEGLSLFSPIEGVLFTMKVALIAALVVGLPYLLWQIWAFIAAGLYPAERKTVLRYVPFSLLLATAGVLFGYFFMIPLVLEYLFLMVDPDLFVQSYRLDYYFSFFLMLTLALALVFQLPLIMLGLSVTGLVRAATFRKYRKHFILGAFIVCAVLTPPDPFSQSLMAVPTILLYEAGILLVAARERRRPPAAPERPEGAAA
jgi:Tat protein translocase TatC